MISPSTNFYVSLDGDDTWSGTRAEPAMGRDGGPFRTLERARDEVRKLKAASPGAEGGYTVFVRAGVYTRDSSFLLDARDSGTPTAPMLYRAYPGAQVVLTGGLAVPPDAFGPVTDPKVLARLDPAARGRVRQTDLRALGVSDLDPLPVKYWSTPAVPELFFNDEPMTVARWPNEGWDTIARIIEPGTCPRAGEKGDKGGVFEYAGDRPSRWDVEAGVWLCGFWCFDWYSEVIKVKAIDIRNRRITLAAPSVYGVIQGNPSPRRFFALHLLEELNCPGEYFIDSSAGLLYFWPPGPLAGARIVLSTLKGPVVVVKDANDVTLQGFTVEASLENGMEVMGGDGVRIQACEVRNTRGVAIDVSGGTNHKVEACDIHDTGEGGIILTGGDRKALVPSGHEAISNHIRRFSRHRLTYASALSLRGVGCRAAHNLLHDAPHQAVGIYGNDHIFEYNVVHHVCRATDDCGAYYKGRNPSCRGNVIRYNFWHDIGRPMGHGSAALYFDDGDGGDVVLGNVFLRCGDPGKDAFGVVFSHGGHDILAENNIFIDCKHALGSFPWDDERWVDAIRTWGDGDWQQKLLKEVDITQPPYTTRYPDLIGFLDPKPGLPRINRAVRNVFFKCAETSGGNWKVSPTENWTTDRDPGFVNAAEGDFRLDSNAEVFTKLPGFQPIPFEKMGLIEERCVFDGHDRE